MTIGRVLLLGDSIIDNRAYVGPDDPDVTQQIRDLLPAHAIEMRAYDGSVTKDVAAQQINDIKADDLVVLSTGGNDALSHASLLEQDVGTLELMGRLWSAREDFRADYTALLEGILAQQPTLLALTIYNPNFQHSGMDSSYQRAAECGVALFNDVIQQEVVARGCTVLELRSFFEAPDDYANAIEPSASGGEKIAWRVSRWAHAKPGSVNGVV